MSAISISIVFAFSVFAAPPAGEADVAPAPMSVPDSALEAIKGRRIEATTHAGMSAVGELAGFDADNLTLIKDDGQVVVLPRGEVASLKLADTPAAAAPAPATPVVTPTAEPSPLPEPAPEPAPAPAPAPAPEFAPAPAPEFAPAPAPTAGQAPAPTSPAMDAPLDRAALLRKRNTALGVGGGFAGLGAVLLGTAFVPRSNRNKAWDALDACDASGTSDPAICDEIFADTKKFHLQWTALWVSGAVSLAASLPAFIVAGKTSAKLKKVAVLPAMGPTFAGVTTRFRF